MRTSSRAQPPPRDTRRQFVRLDRVVQFTLCVLPDVLPSVEERLSFRAVLCLQCPQFEEPRIARREEFTHRWVSQSPLLLMTLGMRQNGDPVYLHVRGHQIQELDILVVPVAWIIEHRREIPADRLAQLSGGPTFALQEIK